VWVKTSGLINSLVSYLQLPDGLGFGEPAFGNGQLKLPWGFFCWSGRVGSSELGSRGIKGIPGQSPAGWGASEKEMEVWREPCSKRGMKVTHEGRV